ncbi:sulfatase family protein [Pedobacter arcticus]|uniref:sulfatase family protein n=1 Tax=Pedobacter arcticus TaxID=752140 RepID=UPI0002FB63AC|nr:sulfatase [Pedobacter arcticus]
MQLIEKLFLLLFLTGLWQPATSQTLPQSKPNIVCLVLEDTSPYQFGCYGNKSIQTPTIDSLAKKGIRYTNASANAPHCSPARSTLITGVYATTYGMDIHREEFITPQNIFYPTFLREAGYFCTNNAKTDYNSTADPQKMWDESGKLATYNSKKRKPGQPFFAVFNTEATHMGLIRTITTEGRPDFKASGIDVDKIFIPPHVPDFPETRSDEAYKLKAAQESDAWVKGHLDNLKAKGLADNTIVFFFSDHGGCLPRGKGFPFESGLRIALVVYIPPALQQKMNTKENTVETKNVGFVDFAPTFLSLIGEKTPAYMQGKAFLGKYETAPRELQYGFRSNQENYHYDPCRTVTDGKLKYIRNYITYKPFALRNLYQSGMPANMAWDRYVLSGKCTNEDWLMEYKAKESELLFDIEKDPWELNNLAKNPAYKEKLTFFRTAVSNQIRSTKDLGFFPREVRSTKKNGLYQWVRDTNFPLDELYNAVELASVAGKADVPQLLKYLKSPHAEIRYWGVVGFCRLGSQKKITKLPVAVKQAMNDKVPEVAIMASEAVCYLGEFDLGVKKLISLFKDNSDPAYSSLETLTWYPVEKKKLQNYTATFQSIVAEQDKKEQDRMGLGVKVRSILVNLGALTIDELYTQADIQEGIKKNKAGRKFYYPKEIQ